MGQCLFRTQTRRFLGYSPDTAWRMKLWHLSVVGLIKYAPCRLSCFASQTLSAGTKQLIAGARDHLEKDKLLIGLSERLQRAVRSLSFSDRGEPQKVFFSVWELEAA